MVVGFCKWDIDSESGSNSYPRVNVYVTAKLSENSFRYRKTDADAVAEVLAFPLPQLSELTLFVVGVGRAKRLEYTHEIGFWDPDPFVRNGYLKNFVSVFNTD